MIDINPKSALEQPIYMLTKATSCPYLIGKVEKRIATDISYNKKIYEELSFNGFRRVENWMYRPVCDNCSACKSYRVDIQKFQITKSLKRVSRNFKNFSYKLAKNISNKDHFELFKKYQYNEKIHNPKTLNLLVFNPHLQGLEKTMPISSVSKE